MLAHNSLLFVHILLFCLWLGMDVGVYYCGKFTTRADLTYIERKRFLELLMLLDMGPRTALVLMVPVGGQLGANLGLIPFSALQLGLLWVVGLAWLAIVWAQYLWPNHTSVPLMASVDYGLRYVAIGAFVFGGLYAIFADDLVIGAWLRLKLVFYGAVISIGLILRSTLAPWLLALERINETGGEDGQQQIEAVFQFSGRWAHTLWLLVLAMAFLGTTKPF